VGKYVVYFYEQLTKYFGDMQQAGVVYPVRSCVPVSICGHFLSFVVQLWSFSLAIYA
jgi:hypothetical protein